MIITAINNTGITIRSFSLKIGLLSVRSVESFCLLEMKSTIEIMSQRFPLVIKNMMNYIDDNSLVTFKKAGRNNRNYLLFSRFYWIRIIQSNNRLFGNFQEEWRKVVIRTPVGIVRELALTLHEFPLFMKRKCGNDTLASIDLVLKIVRHWHPMVVGAICGSEFLCNHIMQKTGGKGAWMQFIGKPLQLAASTSDLDVVRLVMARWVRFIDVKIASTYIPNYSKIVISYN